MERPLSLVELAVHGYNSARISKGSWLEHTFGNTQREVEIHERAGRFNKSKDSGTER